MTYAVVGLGQDAVVSCPWPWQTPVCPPECYCEFYGGYYEDDEVYVLRVEVTGISAIDTTSRALLFARALGESFMTTNPADVRGVAFKKSGEGRWTVEIVYTTSDSGTPVAQHSDSGLRDKVNENVNLRNEFPGFSVASARRLRLIAPAAVTYWRSAPIVWSADSGSTIAYDRGDNVWAGSSAQRQSQLQPKEPAPIGPNGGDTGKPKTLSDGAVVGLIAVGAIVLFALRGRKRKAA